MYLRQFKPEHLHVCFIPDPVIPTHGPAHPLKTELKITQISGEQSFEHKPNCMPERRIRWLALRHYSITAGGNCSSWERESHEKIPWKIRHQEKEDNTRKLTPCVWSTVSLTSSWMSLDQVVETTLISVTWLDVVQFSLFLPNFCPQLKADQCLIGICVFICRWSLIQSVLFSSATWFCVFIPWMFAHI